METQYEMQKYYQNPLQVLKEISEPLLKKFSLLQNVVQYCQDFLQKHRTDLSKKELKECYVYARVMSNIMSDYIQQVFWQSLNYVKQFSLNPQMILQYNYLEMAQNQIENSVNTIDTIIVDTWKDWSENNVKQFAGIVVKKQRERVKEKWEWARSNFERLVDEVEKRKKLIEESGEQKIILPNDNLFEITNLTKEKED